MDAGGVSSISLNGNTVNGTVQVSITNTGITNYSLNNVILVINEL